MLDIVDGANVENYHVDWIFVSPEEYERVQTKLVTYNLAQDLKAKIDEALEKVLMFLRLRMFMKILQAPTNSLQLPLKV